MSYFFFFPPFLAAFFLVAFFFAGIGESPPQWCNPSAHGLTVATDIHVLAAELLGLGAATMQRSRARDVATVMP